MAIKELLVIILNLIYYLEVIEGVYGVRSYTLAMVFEKVLKAHGNGGEEREVPAHKFAFGYQIKLIYKRRSIL